MPDADHPYHDEIEDQRPRVTKTECTCPSHSETKAVAGWDQHCPLHGEAEVQRRFGMSTEELAEEAERGYPVEDLGSLTGSCPHDNHSLMCQCHRGEAILADIPPAVGESLRQRHIRQRECARVSARIDALSALIEDKPPTGHFARAVAEEAIALFTGERNASYGDATDNFQDIGDLWAVVFGHPVSAEQVAICSALIKVARLKTSPDLADNWTDATAYLALGGGINRRRQS